VIDAIPTLAWCNLPDGPNEFLNKRWHEYTGLSHETIERLGWASCVSSGGRTPLMEKWRQLLVSGEPGEMEARLRRHDGVYRWFLIRVEPFRDERGQLVRLYGTSTDIDALKQTQEKLREEEQELRRLLTRYRRRLLFSTRLALPYTRTRRRWAIRALRRKMWFLRASANECFIPTTWRDSAMSGRLLLATGSV